MATDFSVTETELSLSAVLRAVADAMDHGASQPISVTMYTGMNASLHLQDQRDWEEWVAVFGGSPVDAVSMPHGTNFHITWSNESVSAMYIRHPL